MNRLRDFSKEQIINKIKFENPWWQNFKIDDYYSSMKRRLYFDIFSPLVYEKNIKRAIVLMGPRRVGKTVMLFHLIQDLLDNKVPSKNICYLSIENPIYTGLSLEEMFHYFLEQTEQDIHGEHFIIFDEIQYLKNWEVHLKTLVDSYHKVKFIVSGSAAAALQLKSNESGAGRFTDFMLPPLTFHEYISNVIAVANPMPTNKSDKYIDKTQKSKFVRNGGIMGGGEIGAPRSLWRPTSGSCNL